MMGSLEIYMKVIYMKKLVAKVELLMTFVLIGSLTFVSFAQVEEDLSKNPQFINQAESAICRFTGRPIIAIISIEKDKISPFRDEYTVVTEQAGPFTVDEYGEVVMVRYFLHPEPNIRILTTENAKDLAERFLKVSGISLKGFTLTRTDEPPAEAEIKVYHFCWHQLVDGVKGPNWIAVAVDAQTGAIWLFHRWIERNITVPTKPNITEPEAIDLAKKSVPFEVTAVNAKLDIWYDHRVQSKNRPQLLRWVVDLDILQPHFNLKTLQDEMRDGKARVWINAITGEVYDATWTY